MDYQIISKIAPLSNITEQYRKLRTAVDYSSMDKEIKVINFTSSFPEEGKTLTGLNLATVYAQTGKKVLIIDLDLRKPKVHRAFKVSNKNGIVDIVANDLKIEDAIVSVDTNLDVIVTGGKVPFPTEILNSKKLGNIIQELKEQYDKIIVDCPPLTAVADATVISNLCDGTIFTVGYRKTNKDIAKSVLKQLESTGANVIGGIMTQVNTREVYYGMGYYSYNE